MCLSWRSSVLRWEWGVFALHGCSSMRLLRFEKACPGLLQECRTQRKRQQHGGGFDSGLPYEPRKKTPPPCNGRDWSCRSQECCCIIWYRKLLKNWQPSNTPVLSPRSHTLSLISGKRQNSNKTFSPVSQKAKSIQVRRKEHSIWMKQKRFTRVNLPSSIMVTVNGLQCLTQSCR